MLKNSFCVRLRTSSLFLNVVTCCIFKVIVQLIVCPHVDSILLRKQGQRKKGKRGEKDKKGKQEEHFSVHFSRFTSCSDSALANFPLFSFLDLS